MQSSVSFYPHPVHLSLFNLQTSVWSSSASLVRLIQLLPSLRQCVASPVAPYLHQNSASWCQSPGISGAGWDVTVGPWRSAVNEALIAALASAAELHLLAPEEAGRGRGCCCCASVFLSEFLFQQSFSRVFGIHPSVGNGCVFRKQELVAVSGVLCSCARKHRCKSNMP